MFHPLFTYEENVYWPQCSKTEELKLLKARLMLIPFTDISRAIA